MNDTPRPLTIVIAAATLIALVAGGYGLMRASDLEARCDSVEAMRSGPPTRVTPPLAAPGPKASEAAPVTPAFDPDRVKEAGERAGRLKGAVAASRRSGPAGPPPPEAVRAVDDAFPQALVDLETELRERVTVEKVLEPLGYPSLESWKNSHKDSLAQARIQEADVECVFGCVVRGVEARNGAIAEYVKQYKESGVWDDQKLQQGMGAAMGVFSSGIQEKHPAKMNQLWSVFWDVYTIPEQVKDHGDWQVVYSSERNMNVKIRAEWK